MSRGDDDIRNLRRAIGRAVDAINQSSTTKQLAIGSTSGILTGYVTMKIGKVAAVAVGGGIILLQIAQNQGYITVDWKKVKHNTEQAVERLDSNRYAKEAPGMLHKAVDFAKSNTCFAAGFLGGFLIGLSL